MCRYASPSPPRLAAVSAIERQAIAAGSRSSGCATAAGGCTHSSPKSASGSVRQKGEATANGCTAEYTSCTKPGRVSCAELAPPPTLPIASKTVTLRPARARAIAADRPLGPAPTTIASGDAAIGLLRLGGCGRFFHPGVVMVHESLGYWHSRWLFERGLSVIYLVAFVVTLNQFVP